MLLPNKKILYSGTISGLRISAVDGTAFLDACPALTDYADGTNEITIYDSAGAFIRAVLKVQGTGETLGADVLSGWNLTSGWSILGSVTIVDVDTFSGIGGVVKNYLTPLKLYKISNSIATTATTCDVRVCTISGTIWQIFAKNSSGYSTTISLFTCIQVRNSTDGTTDISVLMAEQVLTPSTDGVILQASKWDATENLGYANPAFTYDEASYFCTIRKMRG